MRSNSGKDEARNNLHDPTLRDHGKDPTDAKEPAPGHAKAPADRRKSRKH